MGMAQSSFEHSYSSFRILVGGRIDGESRVRLFSNRGL